MNIQLIREAVLSNCILETNLKSAIASLEFVNEAIDSGEISLDAKTQVSIISGAISLIQQRFPDMWAVRARLINELPAVPE
jgi:hypothetical protein